MGMSTAQEIEDAIRTLSKKEREKLVSDLPTILPELSADAEWDRIVNDPRPRPALTALGDSIAAEMRAHPESFPKVKDSDFNSRK
jgi:hypothetical protein